jgi:hypothetical protein
MITKYIYKIKMTYKRFDLKIIIPNKFEKPKIIFQTKYNNDEKLLNYIKNT